MALETKTNKILKDLASLLVEKETQYLGPAPGPNRQLSFPFSSGVVHHEVLVRQIGKPEWVLELEGDHAKLKFACENALKHEAELEHIPQRILHDELWKFCCDIAVNRKKYKANPSELKKRIDALVKTLAKPHQKWEVLFEIEFLELASLPPPFDISVRIGTRIETATVRFAMVDDSVRQQWGVQSPSTEGHESFDGYPMMGPMAIVELGAGSRDKAVARARQACDTALNLLRTAILSTDSVYSDIQLRQRRRENYWARAVTSGTRTSGWVAEGPTVLRFGQNELDATSKLLSGIGTISAGRSPKISEAFTRAYEWVGTSATRLDADGKVVDLCTALECVLTSAESEGLKGERVALRSLILVGIPPHPIEGVRVDRLYEYYEKRSDLVHGSERDLCVEGDAQELRRWTLRVIENAQTFIRARPEITKLHLLYHALETEQNLDQAIKYLESWPAAPKDAPISQVLKFARCKLSDLNGD